VFVDAYILVHAGRAPVVSLAAISWELVPGSNTNPVEFGNQERISLRRLEGVMFENVGGVAAYESAYPLFVARAGLAGKFVPWLRRPVAGESA
jgi:hypothetical protein